MKTPKLTILIARAAGWLGNKGYGSGLNYTTTQVSGLMAMFALEVITSDTTYCGDEGEANMKAELKEIMHACGDEFDFLRMINEAKEELREAAFDLDQESRMNGV